MLPCDLNLGDLRRLLFLPALLEYRQLAGVSGRLLMRGLPLLHGARRFVRYLLHVLELDLLLGSRHIHMRDCRLLLLSPLLEQRVAVSVPSVLLSLLYRAGVLRLVPFQRPSGRLLGKPRLR